MKHCEYFIKLKITYYIITGWFLYIESHMGKRSESKKKQSIFKNWSFFLRYLFLISVHFALIFLSSAVFFFSQLFQPISLIVVL